MKAITGASKGRLTKREERINSHEQSELGKNERINFTDWSEINDWNSHPEG